MKCKKRESEEIVREGANRVLGTLCVHKVVRIYSTPFFERG